MAKRDKNKYNEYMKEYVRKRYVKLKLDAIEYKGGSCKTCGYSKCPAAMIFHHRDPNEKEMEWVQLRTHSWSRIKEELDKCNLMCCRCHHELHYDDNIAREAIKWLNERKENRLRGANWERNGKCLTCSKPFVRTRRNRIKKYCSQACSHKAQEKANWPSDEDLIKMVKSLGKNQVAMRLGVGHYAVNKRCKRIMKKVS